MTGNNSKDTEDAKTTTEPIVDIEPSKTTTPSQATAPSQATVPSKATAPKRRLSIKARETIVSYIFLAPFLTVFTVFLAWPVIYSLYLSFHEVSIFTDWYNVFTDMKLCSHSGFGNYVTILTQDTKFWWSLVFTLCYGLITIPTGIICSLILAILLSNKLKGSSIYRSAFFLPNVLDILIVGIIWVLIYSPEFGLLENGINYIIETFRPILTTTGILSILESIFNTIVAYIILITHQCQMLFPDSSLPNLFFKGLSIFAESWGPNLLPEGGLLGHPITVLPAIGFAMVLKGAGFGMVLLLTSIQNIPTSVYEAADIDGATPWQKIKHITLPLLKPIFMFLVITGTMACLNAFSEIYAMTNSTGGPTTELAGTTVKTANLSGFYLFTKFQRGQYGYSAALSFILLIIALSISIVSVRLLRSDE